MDKQGLIETDVMLKSKICNILCEFFNRMNGCEPVYDRENILNTFANKIHDLIKNGKAGTY